MWGEQNQATILLSLCHQALRYQGRIACVAWRFWLLSNKGGRGQKNREEIGAGATGFSFSRGFAARSRALRARISRLRRSCARLDKTAMLRRLRDVAKIKQAKRK